MYKFADIRPVKDAQALLPTEALTINDVCLDEKIPGYRTLSVSGRELRGRKITDEVLGNADGSHFFYGQYEPRKIKVTYQLICPDAISFRNAYNELNTYLSAQQARFVFNDEPDKYFVGTVSNATDPADGLNAIKADFEIYCSDPFKYATTQKEFTATINEPSQGTVTVENTGNCPAILSYDMQFPTENGFIGIQSEYGALEFGNAGERDWEMVAGNRVLVLSDLSQISGETSKNPATPQYPSHLKFAPISTIKFAKYKSKVEQTYECLEVTDWKTGRQPNDLVNYAVRFIELETPVSDFEFSTWLHYFKNHVYETGETYFVFTDENDTVIFQWGMWSQNQGSYLCTELFLSLGQPLLYRDFDAYKGSYTDRYNPYSYYGGPMNITRKGSKVTVKNRLFSKTFNISGIQNMKVKKIYVGIGNYTKARAAMVIKYSEFWFWNTNGLERKNIKNRFRAGSEVIVDGFEGKFYLNGSNEPDQEVLGSTYFQCPPGKMDIHFNFSDWLAKAPTVKVSVQERWL